MGGVVAWATGGVFLQGEMQGMMIGAGISCMVVEPHLK
jgi:hypothetical protein